ncbi:glycosyltransferase family 4 protein [Marinilabilia salmonicolor]|uniref:glycosyltransferase family 4 protein n=1 Tax=Marinilabilia salmonicolor TaxID=989 RepID=UPI00029A5F32|nr:glycosyltransferase family 4 protein [Marinilabilia salmonicolor]
MIGDKIKILFTIPNFDSAGSGKHMIDLIKELDNELFAPAICCEHTRGDFFKYVEQLGYPLYIRTTAPRRNNYFREMKMMFQNSRFFALEKFDIIHSFDWKSDWFEPLSARFAGIPWVYTKKSMTWNKHWTIRDKLASYTFILNPEMTDLFPLSMKTTKCVGLGPNITEIERKKSLLSRSELKEYFGVENKFVFLTIANLVPIKNIELLVNAFAKIDHPEKYHLFIVGDDSTEYGTFIRNLIKRLGYEKHITLTGKTMNVEKYLRIADLYVQPSLSEASGVACMEACAFGIPSIGSDVPGLRFVLGNGELLFDPHSEESFLKLLRVVSNKTKSELDEIGSALRKRMYDFFHLPNVAKEHEIIYSFIIEKMKNTR